jgi:hypothetical protein
MKLFLDTNILLDVLLARPEFCGDSAIVWDLCESNRAQGFVSSVSVSNAHYNIGKRLGKDKALAGVKLALSIFDVVPADKDLLIHATSFPRPDFEDVIQMLSAKRTAAEYLLTRDPQHFKSAPVPALSPAEYVRKLSA